VNAALANIIILAGSPAVGKTSVAEEVRRRVGGAVIDMGRFREMYLDPEWKNANQEESDMAFRLACYVSKEFVRNSIRPVLITDTLPRHLPLSFQELAGTGFKIVLLFVTGKDVLQQRMQDPTRDSGFSDLEVSWQRNVAEQERTPHANELRIDTTSLAVEQTASEVIRLMGW
jgi:broad-specificity NMP kinase